MEELRETTPPAGQQPQGQADRQAEADAERGGFIFFRLIRWLFVARNDFNSDTILQQISAFLQCVTDSNTAYLKLHTCSQLLSQCSDTQRHYFLGLVDFFFSHFFL